MRVLVCVAVLVGGILGSSDTYDYSAQSGWGGTCTSGTKQSPVDVVTPGSATKVSGTLISLPAGASAAKMTNLDNHNTIKFSFPNNQTISIPGLSNTTATLVQLHIHWGANDTQGSEHSLDAKYYQSEAHLVTSYTDSGATKYAVINRFFKLGDENAQIKQMIAAQNSSADISSFDASAMFPSTISTVLTYNGSLTTPSCDEKVFWVIVPDPLTISSAQLASLRTLKLGNGTSAAKTFNWRNKQSTNSRTFTKYSSGVRSLLSPLLLLATLLKLSL